MAKDRLRAGHFDDELATMDRPVMGGAQGDEVLESVTAAVGAWADMVDVDEVAVGAARDLAAVMIASEDGAAHGGGNGLPRAAHMGRARRGCIGGAGRRRSSGLGCVCRAVLVGGADGDA